MAGAGRSVDETRTLISNSMRNQNQAHVQSKLDPLIPRMWQESHRDWAMRTATLMQENLRGGQASLHVLADYILQCGRYVSTFDPDRANRDTIRIDFGCIVDTAYDWGLPKCSYKQ